MILVPHLNWVKTSNEFCYYFYPLFDGTLNYKETISIRCKVCNLLMCLPNHSVIISNDILNVSPSIVCPHQPCSGHYHIINERVSIMGTHKELRDGKLVDVDDVTNKVVDEVTADGPLKSEHEVTTDFGNSPINPVGVVGPLEGGKGNDVPVSEVLTDAKNAMVNTPGRVADPNKERVDAIKEELKDQGDVVVNKDTLRQIESEGRAAADRDREDARKLPHDGPNQPDNADATVVRDDGTVTTEHKPNLTATYLHGTRVLITDEQREQYDNMIKELADLQGDTGTADIPLGDKYWAKKQELDAFVARLKR